MQQQQQHGGALSADPNPMSKRKTTKTKKQRKAQKQLGEIVFVDPNTGETRTMPYTEQNHEAFMTNVASMLRAAFGE